jgi:hypothetical protein
MLKLLSKAFLINTLIFITYVPLLILGLFVVAAALLYPDDSKREATYKTRDGHEWWFRNLSWKWAWWWGNDVDGFLGDDDFRWASRDIPFGLKNTSFLGQWWWGAIRNMLGNYKRFVIACDVRECTYELLVGQEYVRDDPENTGFQLLRATRRRDGKEYYRIYWVWKWPGLARAFIVEIGHEFTGKHFKENYVGREYKAFKGHSYIIHPFKKI